MKNLTQRVVINNFNGKWLCYIRRAYSDVCCIYTAGCQALVGCLPYFIRNHALLFAFRVLYGTLLIYHTDDSILIDTSCSTQQICRNRYGDNGILWGGLPFTFKQTHIVSHTFYYIVQIKEYIG